MNGEALEAADVRGWSLVSGLGRVAFGIGMLAAPEPALRALGFNDVDHTTLVVSRVAGIRDLVLGVVTLTALDDRDRLRTATVANAVADAGDTFAFASALGTTERAAGSRGMAFALPSAIAGLWTAWRLS